MNEIIDENTYHDLAKQLEEYEKSKLGYLEMKAVTETAERDGVKKGEDKKEIQAVLGLIDNAIPISIIAKSLNITEQKVQEIIEAHSKNK